MAKAKRERRNSFRTMQPDDATDVLDRFAAIESTQAATVTDPEPPPAEPDQGVDEADTDAGGDF